MTDGDPVPEILWASGPLVALDKPAGWRTDGSRDEAQSLVAWIAQSELPRGTAPVHRLDKATSGVVLCATSSEARRELSALFVSGDVDKRYLCLVHGEAADEGVIDRPLQDGRRRHAIEAITRYRCVERLGRFTLLEARPITGRKHQLRRHLQLAGHAIIGDDRYRPRQPRRVPAHPGRLWLHAASVTLPGRQPILARLPPPLELHLASLRPPTNRGDRG